MKTLKQKRFAVNKLYLKAFCKKHHTYYDEVNDHMVLIGDSYFDLSDIFLDIDKNCDGNLIWEWYSATLDRAMEEKPVINYNSWIAGLRYDGIEEELMFVPLFK
jgi:hypothetical protein